MAKYKFYVGGLHEAKQTSPNIKQTVFYYVLYIYIYISSKYNSCSGTNTPGVCIVKLLVVIKSNEKCSIWYQGLPFAMLRRGGK